MTDDLYITAAKKITTLMPRIRRIMHALEGNSKDPKARNIPPVQFFVIRRLSENGPLSMGEIAKMIRTSKPNLTMLVDRMEKAGLVQRVPDQNDRRIINVTLTQNAIEQLEELSQRHIESTTKSLECLDKNDIARLNNAMDVMIEILGKL